MMITKLLAGTALRRTILEQSFRARVGHIGSALSISDLVAAVVNVLPSVTSELPSRDRFVLSKGHASLAWYSALEQAGTIPTELLNTFCADGSTLGVHPEPHTPGVDFGTGSLGMGVSYGVGTALAAKLRGESSRTAVIMSDAECNEGIAWEAAAFAAQHQLDQLVVLVDDNKQQALGSTAEILDQNLLADRWRAFGWHVVVCDGHDAASLEGAIQTVTPGKPTVIVAQTIFGYGVPYMERQLAWHYLPMNDDQFAEAISELY
jgi:transketolase